MPHQMPADLDLHRFQEGFLNLEKSYVHNALIMLNTVFNPLTLSDHNIHHS